MKVLSLFDGMSCGQIALERTGVAVESYYASEIDKHAIKVTMANYPNTIQLGSVTDVKGFDVDLLIGGSPCQGFSFAGKGLNFEDPRSKLFFEYVRILNECRAINPNVKFLLENVKMKKEYQDIISGYLEVNPVSINSNIFSAQNRTRLYWANFEINELSEKSPLVLKDVLENYPFDNFCTSANTNPSNNGMNGKIHSVELKSPCLTTNKGEGLKISYLTKKQVDRGYYQASEKIWKKSGNRMGKMDFPNDINKKANHNTVVQTLGGRETNHVLDGYHYRKLTPIECERLQTMPDDYSGSISNAQRYKGIGNGWTVDVIAHIFKSL